MNPQQNIPQHPTSSARKKGVKLPIILMAWPATAIVVCIVLSMISNSLIQDPISAVDGELFTQTSSIKAVFNTILFIIGGASVAFGPISFVVGLVLLVQRKSGK